jgi:hypothetical protein
MPQAQWLHLPSVDRHCRLLERLKFVTSTVVSGVLSHALRVNSWCAQCTRWRCDDNSGRAAVVLCIACLCVRLVCGSVHDSTKILWELWQGVHNLRPCVGAHTCVCLSVDNCMHFASVCLCYGVVASSAAKFAHQATA